MNAQDTINAVKAATTEAELDALVIEGEARTTVLAAIAAKRATLVAPGEETDPEDDGLVEVLTLGDEGQTRQLHVNGVAVSVACGIVMRVTPEAAEQLRQCNLI